MKRLMYALRRKRAQGMDIEIELVKSGIYPAARTLAV